MYVNPSRFSAPPKSSRREEQLRQIASQKIDEVDLAKWQIKIGNRSLVLRDQFDKAVKVVIATKEFISSAVSSEPHAALAWAGVCIFLPVKTPSKFYLVLIRF